MELKLTPAERSALRAQAHALDPVVMIGADGLTPAVIREIDANLKAHELIKIRVHGDDRAQRAAFMDRICGALDAAPVQHIGKLLVVWREKPAPAPRAFAARSGGKPAAAGRKAGGRAATSGRAAVPGRASASSRAAAPGRAVAAGRGDQPGRAAKPGGATKPGSTAKPARAAAPGAGARRRAATPADSTERAGRIGAAPRKSAGAAPREVVVVKPSRSGRRPATRKQVTLLGNQRVTSGGLVKRSKPRQKSVKKRA